MSKYNFDPQEFEYVENERLRERRKREIMQQRLRKKVLNFHSGRKAFKRTVPKVVS